MSIHPVCEKRLQGTILYIKYMKERKRKENFLCVIGVSLERAEKIGVVKFQTVQLYVELHLESYITTGHSTCVLI